MAETKWYAPIFDEGYSCFKRGIIDCPFEVGTRKYKEWCRGFNSAYFDNLKEPVSNHAQAL